MGLIYEDDRSSASSAFSAGSGEQSSHALLTLSKKEKPAEGIVLPTDSLELIPLPKNK